MEGAPLDEPNVFNSLFPFRRRGTYSPCENFLTEALVYVLRTCPAAMSAWLQLLTDRYEASVDIETRGRITDDDQSSSYPDVIVRQGHREGPILAVVEHKWDADCDVGQLRRYGEWLLKPPRPENARLIFVGARPDQKAKAEDVFKDLEMDQCQGRAFLWEDIFKALDKVTTNTKTRSALAELLEFMKDHGLAPLEPISPSVISALSGFSVKGVKDPQEASAKSMQLFKGYLSKLRWGRDWSFVPEYYCKGKGSVIRVMDRSGTVAIEFWSATEGCAVTMGVLIDSKVDFGVELTEGPSPDLFLRVEADPDSDARFAKLRDALKRPAGYRVEPASVLVHGDKGNGNRHTLVLIRRNLSRVLSDVSPDSRCQAERIYDTLKGWCEVVFADDSGIKQALSDLQSLETSRP